MRGRRGFTEEGTRRCRGQSSINRAQDSGIVFMGQGIVLGISFGQFWGTRAMLMYITSCSIAFGRKAPLRCGVWVGFWSLSNHDHVLDHVRLLFLFLFTYN